jgi:hypothetical protein
MSGGHPAPRESNDSHSLSFKLFCVQSNHIGLP